MIDLLLRDEVFIEGFQSVRSGCQTTVDLVQSIMVLGVISGFMGCSFQVHSRHLQHRQSLELRLDGLHGRLSCGLSVHRTPVR